MEPNASARSSSEGDYVALTSTPINRDERIEDAEAYDANEGLEAEIDPAISRRLFCSHFLSTWNSRVFEFGAVIFIASIFSNTLLPASFYALVRGWSAVCFAPAVGRYVDREDRLRAVRISIANCKAGLCEETVGQRVMVALSCVGLLVLAMIQSLLPWESFLILAALTTLGCFEKLCSIMNLVAVERDWVIIITAHNHLARQALNSQMRRIDLICKLFGPLAIALIDGVSTFMAILVVLVLSIVSVFMEYYAIANVYSMVSTLQEPRAAASDSEPSETETTRRFYGRALSCLQFTFKPVLIYIQHPVSRASIALSLLHFTVLSFAAQMVTYLLSIGFTSMQTGLLRTLSVAFEISATWLAPLAMRRVGAFRAGLWFLNWQLSCAAAAACAFWTIEEPHLAALGLIAGVILSRVGLWGFDLCVQLIVQEGIDSEARGSFSSVEASFQNLFELLSYASTVAFSRPGQFHYPVLMSSITVFISAILYADFVRDTRGHLLHLSTCGVGGERGRKDSSPRVSIEGLLRNDGRSEDREV